jgi:hypothetical protein
MIGFINAFYIYLNMFKQVIAIIIGSYYLRSYSGDLYYGCIWITISAVWSVVEGCNQVRTVDSVPQELVAFLDN